MTTPIFKALPLDILAEQHRATLAALDGDPFVHGPQDGRIDAGELADVYQKVQSLPDHDPRRRAVLKAVEELHGQDQGVGGTADLFGADLPRLEIAALNDEAGHLAATIDRTLGLPSSNHDGWLDRDEARDALAKSGELTPLQQAYLTRFGKLLGVLPPDQPTVLEGSVTINSLADLEQLKGVGRITGMVQLFPNNWSANETGDADLAAAVAALKGITVEQGIEVNLCYSRVTDLGPLAQLPELTTLYLYDTPAPDLSPLAGLARLQTLYLSGQQVQDIGVTAQLPALRDLVLYNSAVRDLRPLAQCSQLSYVYAYYNPAVADWSCLGELPQLSSLTVGGTQALTDISFTARLPQLQYLTISNTPVRDLGPLAELPNLYFLDAASTPVADLTPLARLPQLSYLYLGDTAATDATPLLQLSSPMTIDLPAGIPLAQVEALRAAFPSCAISQAGTYAGDLTIRGLEDLAQLQGCRQVSGAVRLGEPADQTWLDDGALAQVVAALAGIQVRGGIHLDLGRSPLTDVTPLAALGPQLHSLSMMNTRVADLSPLAACPGLRAFDVCGQQVTDLRVASAWPALEQAQIYDTAIADFSPLGACSALRRLDLAAHPAVSDFKPGLVELAQLEHLGLGSTAIDDIGWLGRLRGIRTLDLGDTPLADASPLLQLDDLRSLVLPAGVSAEQEQALRVRFPACAITRR